MMRTFFLIISSIFILNSYAVPKEIHKDNDNDKVIKSDLLDVQISTNTDRIITADDSLMEEFRFFKNFYIGYINEHKAEDLEYLNHRFSQLDENKLSEIKEKYSHCAEEMGDIIQDIDSKLNDLKHFEIARTQTNMPYSYGNMQLALLHLDSISNAQPEFIEGEIDALRAVCSTQYEEGVEYFLEHIQKKTDIICPENYKSDPYFAKAVLGDLNGSEFIENPRRNAAYRVRISKSPWLKAKYDRWIEIIKERPLDEEALEIEVEILNINLSKDDPDCEKDEDAKDDHKQEEASGGTQQL